jgi:hypothetical protein
MRDSSAGKGRVTVEDLEGRYVQVAVEVEEGPSGSGQEGLGTWLGKLEKALLSSGRAALKMEDGPIAFKRWWY